jgi:hypothetical protein
VIAVVVWWGIWENSQWRNAIPDAWWGEYKSLPDWEKATGRRVIVKVTEGGVSVQQWFDGEVGKPLVRSIQRCRWDTDPKWALHVESKDENVMHFKELGAHVFLVTWSDLNYVGIRRSGDDVYDDLLGRKMG